MPTIHELTVPTLLRGLKVLSNYLDKAEQHAAEAGVAAAELLDARLYPDMLTFTGQIQRASDTAKASVARLTGVAAPSFPDEEASFGELRERVAKTAAFVESVGAESFVGADVRSIELKLRSGSVTFTGADYVSVFMLPNFYFHVATAHAILRHKGVAVGKADYLGRS